MTSAKQKGLSSDRIRGPSGFNVDHLECCICREVLWKPVACQSCETPFCSTCINQWLANNPTQCPNRCRTYTERKCPPFIAKVLAELQIACFYQSNGCKEVISYEGLDKHEIECKFQPTRCPGCQSEMLRQDFDIHQKSCASIELTCQDCKLVYKRDDAAAKHTETICFKEQFRQLRDESKENKHEIQELTRQLNGMQSVLNSLITQTRITFDDLPNVIDEVKLIPDVYNGLKWTKMSYGHELYFKKQYPDSGYAACFATGGSSNIAYFKDDASISVERPNEKFTFVSVNACAAWDDDLQFTITGHRNSIQINTHTTTLLFGKPQFIFLHWRDMDKISFKSSGGTAHPGSGGGSGTYVILTQLTIGTCYEKTEN